MMLRSSRVVLSVKFRLLLLVVLATICSSNGNPDIISRMVTFLHKNNNPNDDNIIIINNNNEKVNDKNKKKNIINTSSSSRARSSNINSSSASMYDEPLAGRTCNGVPAVENHRKACGLYIWNAPSALLYKWCHHLLKDHLYEGKGGHMFVRYESNSILQLLYPCSRYSPNRCLTCGGSYQDHLELWWSRHLYTPYDNYLDKTYQNGLILPDEDEELVKRKQQIRSKTSSQRSNRSSSSSPPRRSSSLSSSSSSSSPKPEVTGPPKFNFHKQYVQDVSDWIKDETTAKRQMERIKEEMMKQAQKNKNNNNKRKGKNKAKNGSGITAAAQDSTKGWRLTRFPRYDIAYIVPHQPMTKDGKRHSFASTFLRTVALAILDDLIILQESENKKLSD